MGAERVEQLGEDGGAGGGLRAQSHGHSCNLTRGLDGGTLLMKSCNQVAAAPLPQTSPLAFYDRGFSRMEL